MGLGCFDASVDTIRWQPMVNHHIQIMLVNCNTGRLFDDVVGKAQEDSLINVQLDLAEQRHSGKIVKIVFVG